LCQLLIGKAPLSMPRPIAGSPDEALVLVSKPQKTPEKLALTAGADPRDAARLANHAAGVVVMKAGAATLSAGELLARLGGDR
jgi:hypothetical protein